MTNTEGGGERVGERESERGREWGREGRERVLVHVTEVVAYSHPFVRDFVISITSLSSQR